MSLGVISLVCFVLQKAEKLQAAWRGHETRTWIQAAAVVRSMQKGLSLGLAQQPANKNASKRDVTGGGKQIEKPSKKAPAKVQATNENTDQRLSGQTTLTRVSLSQNSGELIVPVALQ